MAETKEIKTDIKKQEAEQPATEPRTDLNEGKVPEAKEVNIPDAAPEETAEPKAIDASPDEEEVDEEVLPEEERKGDANTPAADAGMEAPKTKQYNGPKQLVRVTPKFVKELQECIGELPYNFKMGTPERYIEVSQVFNLLRDHGQHFTIPQLNEFMGYVNLAPWNRIHEFTEKIMNSETQKEYLEVYDPTAEEEGKKDVGEKK